MRGAAADGRANVPRPNSCLSYICIGCHPSELRGENGTSITGWGVGNVASRMAIRYCADSANARHYAQQLPTIAGETARATLTALWRRRTNDKFVRNEGRMTTIKSDRSERDSRQALTTNKREKRKKFGVQRTTRVAYKLCNCGEPTTPCPTSFVAPYHARLTRPASAATRRRRASFCSDRTP